MLVIPVFFTGIAGTIAQSTIVDSQLDAIRKTFVKQGYTSTHEVFYRSLDNKESDFYSIDLEAGTDYQIVAACDEDCGDIDMCLFDDNMNQIDCDKTEDDKPLLVFTAEKTETYRIWVKMYDCQIEPCRFGIMVYGK